MRLAPTNLGVELVSSPVNVEAKMLPKSLRVHNSQRECSVEPLRDGAI